MNMRKIATALFVALVALLALPVSDARAQGYYDAPQLNKIKAIKIDVSDGVRDGCLPRPGVLKTEAELILRRSGIKVEPERVSHVLNITLSGFENKTAGGRPVGDCVASLNVQAWSWEVLSDRSFGVVKASEAASVYFGRKSGFQNQLRAAVNELVTELANEILKARANTSSKSQ